MLTLVRLAIVLVGAMAALPVLTSPAHADVTATVSGVEGRVLPGCHNYAVDYDLHLPSGVVSWDATIVEEGYEWSIDLYGYLGDAPSGRRAMYLCSSDFGRDGRVRLEVSGSYRSSDGTTGEIRGEGAIELELARTRTSLAFLPTSTPTYNEVIRLRAHVEVQGQYGYQSARYSKVDIQVRRNGRWVRLKGRSFLTGGNGRSTEVYRWNVRGVETLRLSTPAQEGFGQSTSKPITVRTRR